jgi:hypothetical protein
MPESGIWSVVLDGRNEKEIIMKVKTKIKAGSTTWS